MTSTSDRRAGRDRIRLASLREALAARLWPIPVVAIAVAVILGLALPLVDAVIDEHLPGWLAATLFSGGGNAARAVLSAIAGSLVAATTLTFSLTVVALQLASSQASPRVLRMFTRDSVVHRTLAIFLGTFVFALTVLRSVRDATDDAPGAVPRIAITLAFLLTLASVVTLVLFLAHLARLLRIETVLRDVHEETSGTIALVAGTDDVGNTLEPETVERSPRATAVLAPESGFLTGSDRERLVEIAVDHDLVVEEARAIGGSVVEGTPVAFWWPADTLRIPEDDAVAEIGRKIAQAFGLAYERNPTQDIGFGLRQLADIAVRAVSPGVNDPTTAVHALGHISAVLGDIARLPVQSGVLRDDDGRPRVAVRTHDFAEMVEIGVGQTRRYGAGDPDVVARLYALLREVGYTAQRDTDREVISQQRTRLDATVAATSYDEVERARFAAQSADVVAALDGRWD